MLITPGGIVACASRKGSTNHTFFFLLSLFLRHIIGCARSPSRKGAAEIRARVILQSSARPAYAIGRFNARVVYPFVFGRGALIREWAVDACLIRLRRCHCCRAEEPCGSLYCTATAAAGPQQVHTAIELSLFRARSSLFFTFNLAPDRGRTAMESILIDTAAVLVPSISRIQLGERVSRSLL